MEPVKLGHTGLEVSRVCLGMMSYGDPAWRPWILPEEDARPIVRRAVEAGINFFDTADMYSLGVSEEVTGSLLGELTRRDEVVIATKVYYPMTDRPNRGGLSRKHILDSVRDSLRRLTQPPSDPVSGGSVGRSSVSAAGTPASAASRRLRSG